MIKKITKLFNTIFINNIKLIFIKLFHFRKFKYGFINFISPLACIDIQNDGILIIEEKCNIYSGVKIGVRGKGKIIIKKNTFLNNNCQIIAHKNIEIGKNVSFGPNVLVYDHDHAFNQNGIILGKYNCDDVIIGDNVWIGANSVILKGSKIGNNSIIAAGSIVKGNVPENTVFVQKRNNTFYSNGDKYGKRKSH